MIFKLPIEFSSYVRQAEHLLGDRVSLDLRGTGANRRCTRSQESSRPSAALKRVRVTAYDQPVHAEDLDRELVETLLEQRREQSIQGPERSGVLSAADAIEIG